VIAMQPPSELRPDQPRHSGSPRANEVIQMSIEHPEVEAVVTSCCPDARPAAELVLGSRALRARARAVEDHTATRRAAERIGLLEPSAPRAAGAWS
jgi:hypothetical protein